MMALCRVYDYDDMTRRISVNCAIYRYFGPTEPLADLPFSAYSIRCQYAFSAV